MNSIDLNTSPPRPDLASRCTRLIEAVHAGFGAIGHSAIALLARVSIATTFLLSGQTKIEGLVLDPINGKFVLGLPHLSAGAVDLFRYEYALPLIPPQTAALLAAVAEHVFPLLLLLGLATRLSAFALLLMTLVIQVFVYPSGWPTHALWAALMLYLMARGAGVFSLDRLIARR